jgi:hypothetical protein
LAGWGALPLQADDCGALQRKGAVTPMRRPVFTGCLLLTLAGAAFTQSSAPPDPQPPAASAQPPAQAPAAPDAGAKANDAKPEGKSDASKTDASKTDASKADADKADASTADANKSEADKSAASKAAASKKTEKKQSDRGPEHLAQCLKDWDRGTHMTRQEWERTCRRVVGNRLKFLREQGQ